MANTSEENVWSESDTVAESYYDFTVMDETDSSIHCCRYFAVSVIPFLQLY